MVSLIQLEYIVALDSYRSFSLAADKCFVTQPTLSMQVKKMETDLGITIFDRTKQPIVVTDIGRVIVDQARLVLSESKKIEELIQLSKNTLTGELKIGVIPSIAAYLLPKFLGNLARKHPGIKISVQELLTEEIVENLRTEKIDVGILVTPLEHAGIIETPLFYEKILLYMNAAQEFAKLESIKLSQINTDNLWLLSQGHCFRNQVINLCKIKDSNNALPFEYESASIETLIKFVDKEGGFTLIPELAALDLPDSKKHLAKQIKDVKPIREVSLVTNRVFVKQRILEVLKTEIIQSVPKEMLDKKRGEIVEWK
ncbi:MAG: hydrogen peroxide-inducible genes activator [Crocinitomicaceae bacterium]|nr:hydrogen peroxide-inducible genes activator [Crocinitomicaceae bacterium]